MFDIYPNNFSWLHSDDENILYAYDTSLIYVCGLLDDLPSHVINRLGIIQGWSNTNRISINPAEYEFMLVTNESINITPDLRIGYDRITMVKSFQVFRYAYKQKLKIRTSIKTVGSVQHT